MQLDFIFVVYLHKRSGGNRGTTHQYGSITNMGWARPLPSSQAEITEKSKHLSETTAKCPMSLCG